MKFDPLHFEWFDLHLNPFFEEIMNLNSEMPILASSTCYTQNGDWGGKLVISRVFKRLKTDYWGQGFLCRNPKSTQGFHLCLRNVFAAP